MRKARILVAMVAAALTLPLLAQTSPTASNSPTSLVPPVTPETPTQASVPAPPLPIQGQPLTPENVNAWLDGFMPIAIGRADIPGAVVIVVRDGAVLTQRGYGFSDIARRRPVDPARTLFRPGSVSKLFTWTAVMQQVEQGKLNLDQDVNTYLDFKIPPLDGKPITLRQIMKHTAGFEEQAKGIIATDPAKYNGYEKLLKAWVPGRVYAPGSTPAYSNYATSLAGYIVARVSGQTFDDYIERNIFAPLGMAHSTFRQPLPPRLRPLAAEGYQSGKSEPYGFEYVGPAPAGSLSASGEDMARFMIAHLQGGRGILRPETARLMHTNITKPIPPLNGMALGFYQHDLNGRRVVAHGGDTVAFHSDLNLFLDERVGLFVSFNSGGREGASGALRSALLENFADRYFPGKTDNRRLSEAAARENAQKLAGLWSNSRRSHSSFLAITDLLGQVEVSVGPKGELVVPFAQGLNQQPRTWIAAGPMLWREENGHERLAAQMVNGEAVRFSLNAWAPIMVFDRTPWYRSSAWLLPLAYFSLAALLLTALLWPTRALVRRRFGSTLPLEKRGLQAYRASRIAAVAILATLVGWAVVLGMMLGDINNFTAAFDPFLIILQLLGLVAFVGGLAAMLWYLWAAWSGKWRWTAKLWSIVLVISAATILWIAVVFNLIGWNTSY